MSIAFRASFLVTYHDATYNTSSILFIPMAEQINLKDDHSVFEPKAQTNKKAVREVFKSLIEDDNIEKERLELLENILQRSNVQFASIADKVAIDFSKFTQMIMTHDLTPLMEAQKKFYDAKPENSSMVVISSDLLADISNCERVIDEDEEDTNVLSGIFIYGLFIGIILSLVTALIMQFVNFSIGARDLTFILVGCIVLVLVPVAIIVFEPYLKGMQRSHNEFFERIVHLFSGKL